MGKNYSTVVMISANAEWRSIKKIMSVSEVQHTALGECFARSIGGQEVLFFHGGWGKISAAATAQYVIDRFVPNLLVNLGTCGGFEGEIESGVVIMVEKTIVYDIIEQMSDPDEAIEWYSTDIDNSWLGDFALQDVRKGLLVSADRDIVAQDIPGLIARFGAVAADWESGAIAWVAGRNKVRCLILRGVSDLVGAGGGEVYGDIDLYRQRTDGVMAQLLGHLGALLDSNKV